MNNMKPRPGKPVYTTIDMKKLADKLNANEPKRKVDYQFSNGRKFTSPDR
jgi:hypothetical protein